MGTDGFLRSIFSLVTGGVTPPAQAPVALPVTDADVRAAYRLLLDREPEEEAVVEDKLRRLPDTASLRREFLTSPEFREREAGHAQPTLGGLEPPVPVELEPPAEELEALYAYVRSTWQRLGETDPHWSVSTSEVYRAGRIDETREGFYASGEPDVRRLVAACLRAGLEAPGGGDCLEFGCGVGRVTLWLSRLFRTVHAVDISAAHLAEARAALGARGVTNVVFHELKDPSALGGLPEVDAVFTIAVLQHNPPPVILAALRALLRSLRPGGIAYFQVPTWAPGYSFATRPYLDELSRRDAGMEMHVLPQAAALRAIREAGAEPLEVLEDGIPGPAFRGMSNTFLARRLPAA